MAVEAEIRTEVEPIAAGEGCSALAGRISCHTKDRKRRPEQRRLGRTDSCTTAVPRPSPSLLDASPLYAIGRGENTQPAPPDRQPGLVQSGRTTSCPAEVT